MKKHPFFLLLAITLFILQSCSLSKTMRFIECEFEFKKITLLEAKGISIKDKANALSLSFSEAAKLSGAMLQQNMPIKLDLDVIVKNPGEKEASLTKVDYIIFLGGKQILEGTTNQRIIIKGKQSEILSLSLNFELFQALSGKSGIDITKTIWDLSVDSKRPKNLKIKLRPYINIGNKSIKYPSYIPVNIL